MDKRSYRQRRFWCYLLSIVLAFALLGSNLLVVSSLTVGNRNYMQKYFSEESVTTELSGKLDKSLEVIADDYGIDAEILKSAFSDEYRVSVQDTAMNSLYSSRYTPVSNSLNVEIRCIYAVVKSNSYLEKDKEISDEESSELVADVEKAFDSVYTVANAEDFSNVSKFFSDCTGNAVIFSVLSVILALAVYFVSGRSHGSLNFIAMALESAGGMSVALPLIAFDRLNYSFLSLTNISAYNDVIANAVGRAYLIVIMVGIVMIVAGIAIFISNYKYYSVKLKKSDMEYEIEQNLI